MTEEIKRDAQIVIRVPGKVRRAIDTLVERMPPNAKGKKASQADFVAEVVEEFVIQLQEGCSVDQLALPPGYKIPKGDTRMMSFRAAPETVQLIKEQAPQYYHSQTQFVLWAIANRIQEAVDLKKKKQAEK